MYDSIDILEIDRINFSSNNILVDIRDKYEYNLDHIRSAINIPYTYIITLPDKYLSFDNTYYIYCDCGSKSSKVCQLLSELGYSVVDLIGGYNAYLDRS